MKYRSRIKVLWISLSVWIAASVLYAGLSRSRYAPPKPLYQPKHMPDSIVLRQPDDTLKLVRGSYGWTVNGMPADADRVTLLLATLQQSVVRRPAARNQVDSLNQVFHHASVRVEIFDGSRQPFAFHITGNERQLNSVVLREPGRIFELTIPGYRVYIAGLFFLPEAEWIDRRIFNFNWRNFKSLSVASFLQPADSFTIAFNGRFFAVNDMPTDTARLNTYLDEISLLEADGFLQVHHLPDSLRSAPSVGAITAATVSGDTWSLELYRAGNRLLGITGRLPVAWFNLDKETLLTRRKVWFSLQKQ